METTGQSPLRLASRAVPATSLLLAINVAVADAIFGAIEKGADPLAAISAAVISAADFGRLAFGDEILEQLADTLAMQKDKPLPKIER